MFTTMKIPTR